MSTLQTIASSDTLNPTSLSKINANFSTLNTDKLEASDIAGKQDTLVSGTNIKTINGVTVLGSGNISIPALTDGDKGDMTLSGSGTVWTIDNNVVTNAKLSTVATATIKGRTTAGTGNVEDLTPTQVAGMLPVATTSVAGTMSASDKSKLDTLSGFSGVIATTSSGQTITFNSLDLLNFNSEELDSDGYHNTITNNSRITIPTGIGGKRFLIQGQVEVNDSDAGGAFTLAVYKNGTITRIKNQVYGYLNSSPVYQDACIQVSGVMELADGDYIELYISKSNTGINSATVAGGTWFSCIRLG